MSKLFEKLKEPSTWRGIFILIGIFGTSQIPREQQEIAIQSIAGIWALIEILLKENK